MKRDFLITLNLPDWARWYAVDRDGAVYVYESKPFPFMEYGKWTSGLKPLAALYVFRMRPMDVDDWSQTLHEIERAE